MSLAQTLRDAYIDGYRYGILLSNTEYALTKSKHAGSADELYKYFIEAAARLNKALDFAYKTMSLNPLKEVAFNKGMNEAKRRGASRSISTII